MLPHWNNVPGEALSLEVSECRSGKPFSMSIDFGATLAKMAQDSLLEDKKPACKARAHTRTHKLMTAIRVFNRR